MRVNRYECGMTNAPTEYQSPTMHQDANGGYVSYEDYAALEAKCAALAAELQSVKAMNDCLSEELRGYESDGAFEGPKMHLLWWQCETPNHDDFLAEAHAQGVEMFADHLSGMNISASETSVREFAAQLRKGVQS